MVVRMVFTPNPYKREKIKDGTLLSTRLTGISALTVGADSKRRETFECFVSKIFLYFLPFFTPK